MEKNQACGEGEGVEVAKSLALLESAGVNSSQHRERIASSVPTTVIAFAIRKAAKSKLGVGAWVKWLTDSREVISLCEQAQADAAKRQAASAPAQKAREQVAQQAAIEASAKQDAELIASTDGNTLLATAHQLIQHPPADYPARMRAGLIRGLEGCGPAHPGVIRACVTHGRGWLAALIRGNAENNVEPVLTE